MSWSARIKLTRPDNVEVLESSPGLETNDEAAEQFVAAAALAGQVIDSGVVGYESDYIISVSGHANPDHKPAEGWANDYVNIQVTQV